MKNRTRYLPACSTVLQPTAPLRAPALCVSYENAVVRIFVLKHDKVRSNVNIQPYL
jgi:hypothetical protein